MWELAYLKGGVHEPYKVLWSPFVEWSCHWLVECRHVVWYIHCSWLENAGTWFSKFTVVAQTTWFGIPDVCNVKGVSVCVCVWVSGWVYVCVTVSKTMTYVTARLYLLNLLLHYIYLIWPHSLCAQTSILASKTLWICQWAYCWN